MRAESGAGSAFGRRKSTTTSGGTRRHQADHDERFRFLFFARMAPAIAAEKAMAPQMTIVSTECVRWLERVRLAIWPCACRRREAASDLGGRDAVAGLSSACAGERISRRAEGLAVRCSSRGGDRSACQAATTRPAEPLQRRETVLGTELRAAVLPVSSCAGDGRLRRGCPRRWCPRPARRAAVYGAGARSPWPPARIGIHPRKQASIPPQSRLRRTAPMMPAMFGRSAG